MIIWPATFAVTCMVIEKITKKYRKIRVLQIALCLQFICELFLGPSKVFGFPDKLYVILIGHVLHGLCDSIAFVPTLPEMIESVQPLYPKKMER